jgi:hypothetical protein
MYSKNTMPETHKKELYAYIMGIIKNKKSKLYCIVGAENHNRQFLIDSGIGI